jgi:hypothetical protein
LCITGKTSERPGTFSSPILGKRGNGEEDVTSRFQPIAEIERPAKRKRKSTKLKHKFKGPRHLNLVLKNAS